MTVQPLKIFFQFGSVTVIVISLIFVLYINFVGIDYIPFSNLFIKILKGQGQEWPTTTDLCSDSHGPSIRKDENLENYTAVADMTTG